MSSGNKIILLKSDVPSKESLKQLEMQIHRILSIIKKYPNKDDNPELLHEALKFIESLSWRL
jgi:hypothetical protein